SSQRWREDEVARRRDQASCCDSWLLPLVSSHKCTGADRALRRRKLRASVRSAAQLRRNPWPTSPRSSLRLRPALRPAKRRMSHRLRGVQPSPAFLAANGDDSDRRAAPLQQGRTPSQAPGAQVFALLFCCCCRSLPFRLDGEVRVALPCPRLRSRASSISCVSSGRSLLPEATYLRRSRRG